MITTDDLLPYIGRPVSMWHFTPSHDRLVLRISGIGHEPCYLVISGTEHVHVPMVWTVTRPATVQVDKKLAELLDVDVRVLCQDLSLHPEYHTRCDY